MKTVTKSQSVQQVSRPRFESRTSSILSRSATLSIAMLGLKKCHVANTSDIEFVL
jgi:hypothetical protein